MVKAIAYNSTVVGLSPISILFLKSVFTAPSGKNEPMMSPTSPPTTAPKIKAIIKKVISRPFKLFAPQPDSKCAGVSSFSLIKVTYG